MFWTPRAVGRPLRLGRVGLNACGRTRGRPPFVHSRYQQGRPFVRVEDHAPTQRGLERANGDGEGAPKEGRVQASLGFAGRLTGRIGGSFELPHGHTQGPSAGLASGTIAFNCAATALRGTQAARARSGGLWVVGPAREHMVAVDEVDQPNGEEQGPPPPQRVRLWFGPHGFGSNRIDSRDARKTTRGKHAGRLPVFSKVLAPFRLRRIFLVLRAKQKQFLD